MPIRKKQRPQSTSASPVAQPAQTQSAARSGELFRSNSTGSSSSSASGARLEHSQNNRNQIGAGSGAAFEGAGRSIEREISSSPRPESLRRATSPTDNMSTSSSSTVAQHRLSRRMEDVPPVPPMRPVSMRLVTTIPQSSPTSSQGGHHQGADSSASDSADDHPQQSRSETSENQHQRSSKRESTQSIGGTPSWAVINFDRRPSAIDPLAINAPGSSSSASSSSTRQLVSAGTGRSVSTDAGASAAAAASAAAKEARRSKQIEIDRGGRYTERPVPAEGQGLHQRKRSHNRHPSISLAPTSPAPSEEAHRGTRAPMEAFASIEMLQGQRQHQDRTRGSEIFNSNGFYEGRASIGDQGNYLANARRQDPMEGLRNQRQGYAPRQHSPPIAPGSHAPPLEAAIADIANQLRAVDNGRRESEWRHRLGGDSSDIEGDGSSSGPVTPDLSLNQAFQFPANKPMKPLLLSADSRRAYEASEESDLGTLGPYSEKSAFTDAFTAKMMGNKAAAWSDESLGQNEKEVLDIKRPSIVALPVYPSPSGTNGRSFKNRVKKIAAGATWLTVLLSTAATWVYIAQRLRSLQAVEAEMAGRFVGAWAFFAFEFSIAVILTTIAFWTVFTHRHTASLPKLRLRGDANLPAVDVFIVSSGQSDQTVFDCAIAAAAMDYPAHRYRVMVLDAANSPHLQRELHKHIKTQACPHLSYHRRPMGEDGEVTFNSRASVVNFGISEAKSFGVKGPADLIVVFEADMIPDRNYLRASLPLILADPDVGLVKSPHGFINLPRRLSSSVLTLLQAAETPSEHRSGFIVRRSCLAAIGGFPEKSWIPDGQLEAEILGKGWKVDTAREVLQWTMAQPTYVAQVNALMTNAIGPVRTAGRLGLFLFSSKVKMMPFGQRLKFLGRALLPFSSLFLMLLISLYPFMLSYGGLLVLAPNTDQLLLLLEAALVMIVLSRLHEIVWCWSTGTSSPRRSFQSWLFAAPYHGFALLLLILPAKLGGYSVKSDIPKQQKVDQPTKLSKWKRFGIFIIDPHTGFLIAFATSIGLTIWRIAKENHNELDLETHQVYLSLLLTFAWPTLLWLDFLFAAWVIVPTLLNPSLLLTTPREAFVVRDHYSFVARPKQDFKTFSPWKQHRGPEILSGLFLVIWSVLAVVLVRETHVFI